MADLVVKSGPRAGRRIPIEGDVVIGREGADVVLEDPEVSRRHALVRTLEDAVEIEDLQSTNGTFVNDIEIEGSTRLRKGDSIRVGNTRLEVDEDWKVAETEASTNVYADRDAADEPDTDEHQRPTQVLPSLGDEPVRPARGNRTWLIAGLVVVALVLGVLLYNVLTSDSEDDYAATAASICTAADKAAVNVLRADPDDPSTTNAVAKARAIRIRVGSALRALERPRDLADGLKRFFSAFRGTTTALARFERTLTAANQKAAREAQQDVRAAVKKERRRAKKVGLRDCGGLALG